MVVVNQSAVVDHGHDEGIVVVVIVVQRVEEDAQAVPSVRCQCFKKLFFLRHSNVCSWQAFPASLQIRQKPFLYGTPS